ncbi:MAG: NAD(P)-binding protein, partial [Pseudomonadales bacterium]
KLNNISRRDFLNGALITAGAAFTYQSMPAFAGSSSDSNPEWSQLVVGDDWYGPGGIGDYENCHGNTPTVVTEAHSIRDGFWQTLPKDIITLDEEYDVAIVGGGISGLGAASELMDSFPNCKGLILDNHPIFGGTAKLNEFEIDGVRLYGPQGSNGFVIPPEYKGDAKPTLSDSLEHMDSYWYSRLNLPREYTFGELNGTDKKIRMMKENYAAFFHHYQQYDMAQYYPKDMKGLNPGSPPKMDLNGWSKDLKGAPIPDDFKKELLDTITNKKRPFEGEPEQIAKWLDSMTYKEYLEKHMGYSERVTDYFESFLSSGAGIGADVITAFLPYSYGMPGFGGYINYKSAFGAAERYSFPGGNATISHAFLKNIIPEGIEGDQSIEDISQGKINFDALDRPDLQVRMRLSATVTYVEHTDKNKSKADGVWVCYTKEGKAYRVKAKSVIMASGSWVAKHVVRDLEAYYKEALNEFQNSPFLVANVALNNWHFMEKLGACSVTYPYTEAGFGIGCSIRAPMHLGAYKPPINPAKPAILTFYAPLFVKEVGEHMDLKTKCLLARHKLYSTPYAEYEKRILKQMELMFADYGFDAERDINSIVLNRWGHPLISPGPGFFFGRDGKPSSRDVVLNPMGRIAFAHAEYSGFQHYGAAATCGREAVSNLSRFLIKG